MLRLGSPAKPQAPPPVPLPPPLPPQLGSKDVAAAGASYSAAQATARGLAGTILTSGQGVSTGTGPGKTLTGQ
jgi:hypothetical protein